ncbi:hypothetical protein GGI43DRAFT_421590 [Trichoderma evansii]
MVLNRLRRSRSLESLRKDLFHTITNTTEGIYFLPGASILKDKNSDKELVAVLCPQEGFKATDAGIAHLSKLFVECNRWIPILDERDYDMYWAVTACSTSHSQSIEMPPSMARAVVFSLLRARQRWILRQTDSEASKSNVKSHFTSGLQRLLGRFEERDKNPAIHVSLKDNEWKLTERERKDAREARLMGPGKRISRDRIALSCNTPQRLYPIAQLAGGPQPEANLLGMIDSSVEKITPAEAVQALISHRLAEVRRAQRRAIAEENAKNKVLKNASEEDDARSGSNSIIRPSFRKDSSEKSVESTPKSTPKSAQMVDTPPNTNTNTSSMKRRFLSEEATTTTKKQVFAKGKARSVSMPVVRSLSLSPTKRAEASRSPSLQHDEEFRK